MQTLKQNEITLTSSVRLTQRVKAGGCASKLPPGSLNAVLSRLPRQEHSDFLVGFETADDAGIFRLEPEVALVQTIDFFTPMVDDPFTYGRIAATNALSDVYAMGGKPVSALAVVCFPLDEDLDILEEVMRGGLATMNEAACIVVGGHSVRDEEIKFGYAVTGVVHPEKFITNGGAVAGDILILTKALGTGVITTALKQGKAQPEWTEAAVNSMTTLNKTAAEIAIRNAGHVHAMTDVTGFGLIGHAREMALASNAQTVINTAAIPFLPGALESIAMECIPGGLHANEGFAGCMVEEIASTNIPAEIKRALYDPQTAGGLLIAVAREKASALLAELRAEGCPAAEIGRITEGTPRIILC